MTGAAGFIGSSLAERLIREGCEVLGVDCFSDYYNRSLKEANLAELVDARGFNLVETDLNTVDLAPLVKDVEVIYHLAGQPGVRKSWGSDFAQYITDNISATQRLLEAALHHANDLTRFVYASSSSVYGDAERFPAEETDCPLPRSPYGVTKLAGENLVGLYASNFNLPCASLRFFTVYGPRQRPDMAFNRFISCALQSRSLQVHGDGTQIREFTYIDDIVEANVIAGWAQIDPGVIINLSGGTAISINEVLDLLEDIHGRPLNLEMGEAALGDVFRTGGSTDRALNLLGWQPKVEIQSGLAREYEWLATEVR